MARSRSRLFLFLASLSLLINTAKEDKSSQLDEASLVTKHTTEPGPEKDAHFNNASAHQELRDQTKRRGKRSHTWSWWSRRRRTRRNPSFIARPHCEHENHTHFITRCCSGKFIQDPLLQTCCAGRIVSKNMVPFLCHPSYGCGSFWFDPNRQKCCYGQNNLGCKDVQPGCGLVRYNLSTQRCCDGRYTYYITTQKCCHRRVISRSRTCRF